MNRASHLSLFLARFDSLRAAGALDGQPRDGVLFRGVAADTRAAATEPASQQAFAFLIIGLHVDATSAHRELDERHELAPWLAEAAEVWSAVLQPFRHTGAANYLDRALPGTLFESLGPQPAACAPIVVVTSAGWTVGENFDMNRVREFSTGVMGVRMSMSGVAGLLSQQSFFFPRVLEHDPITVTLWKDTASARAFAYGPGVHKVQMQRQNDQGLADRTSFTRCRVVRAEGTWHGLPLHAVGDGRPAA
jgi:hypothetical protein